MEIEKYSVRMFEDIKHTDEFGNEYWEARELQGLLGYKEWRWFFNVIEKAQIACLQSSNDVNCHFGVYSKIVKAGATSKNIIDYKLSRYACYLIVQNANPKFETVALGQTYFAIQTRKMELTEEEYSKLSEDEKDFIEDNEQEMVIKHYIKLQLLRVLKILISLLMLVIEVYIMVKLPMILQREKDFDIEKRYLIIWVVQNLLQMNLELFKQKSY